MAVVRIPRGFSLMNSKRALIDGSAWTARRYIVLSLERLKEIRKLQLFFNVYSVMLIKESPFYGLI
jgi:hypothetical protein